MCPLNSTWSLPRGAYELGINPRAPPHLAPWARNVSAAAGPGRGRDVGGYGGRDDDDAGGRRFSGARGGRGGGRGEGRGGGRGEGRSGGRGGSRGGGRSYESGGGGRGRGGRGYEGREEQQQQRQQQQRFSLFPSSGGASGQQGEESRSGSSWDHGGDSSERRGGGGSSERWSGDGSRARQGGGGSRERQGGGGSRERQGDGGSSARWGGGGSREHQGGGRPEGRPARFDRPNRSDDYDDYNSDDDRGGRGGRYDDDDNEGYQYPARPSKSALREQLFGDVLYGTAPVLAALRAGRRSPHVLYVQEGAEAGTRKDGKAFQECQDLARAAGAAIREASKHDLNMMSDNRPHQGLLLDCSPLAWEQMDALPDPGPVGGVNGAPRESGGRPEAADEDEEEGEGEERSGREGEEHSGRKVEGAGEAAVSGRYPIWLALDEVVDPQNLGAMLRSAHCLGAAGVVASAKNCAPLSATVSKASAGALEVMTLHNTKNLPRTLADAAGRGWAVVGAAGEAGATPLTEWKVDRPTVLVMGNEGYGLRTNVRRVCTSMVRIEMGSMPSGRRGGPRGAGSSDAAVDSLNVSVAAGILLHHMAASAARR